MEHIHGGPMAGRTVLVTGATSGIGRATALGLATMGATGRHHRPGPRAHRDCGRRDQRGRRQERRRVRRGPVLPGAGAAAGQRGARRACRGSTC